FRAGVSAVHQWRAGFGGERACFCNPEAQLKGPYLHIRAASRHESAACRHKGSSAIGLPQHCVGFGICGKSSATIKHFIAPGIALHKYIRTSALKKTSITYADSGVDIDRADRAKQRIKYLAHRTFTPGVVSEIGGFGGMFAVDKKKFRDPVLVSSVDGVGTKLKVAF